MVFINTYEDPLGQVQTPGSFLKAPKTAEMVAFAHKRFLVN